MNNPRLIFMVDDDPFINKLVEKKFSSLGFTVNTFETGEDCLKELYRKPDIIILDYLFLKDDREYMNGKEVFDKIRENDLKVPVIMLSGQDKGEIVLELARKGISDYVIKDNTLLENLQESVKEILDRQ